MAGELDIKIDRAGRHFVVNGIPRSRRYVEGIAEHVSLYLREFDEFIASSKTEDFVIPLEQDGRVLLEFRDGQLAMWEMRSPYGYWSPTAADLDRLCQEWSKHREKVVNNGD